MKRNWPKLLLYTAGIFAAMPGTGGDELAERQTGLIDGRQLQWAE